MSWPLVEEMAELDPRIVDRELGLREALERLREKLERGEDFTEELKVVEQAVNPLLKYPCKLYFQLLADVLNALKQGTEPAIDPKELVNEILSVWPHACHV